MTKVANRVSYSTRPNHRPGCFAPPPAVLGGLFAILLFLTACTSIPTPLAQETESPVVPAPATASYVAPVPDQTTPPPASTPAAAPLKESPALPTASTPLTPVPSHTPRLPILVSDLLYLSQGNLMRWSPNTDYASVLASRVTDFSVSASGKQILLLRPQQVTGGGKELFKLDLLDLESHQTTTLLAGTARLYRLQISPNGDWVAYTSQDRGGTVSVLPVSPAASPTQGTSNSSGNAQLTVSSGVEAGLCLPETDLDCTSLIWSTNSRELLWTDSRGIWVAQPPRSAAQQVLGNQISVTDPRGGKTDVSVSFDQLSWSPGGRYALAHIAISNSDVHWQAVVDTRMSRLIQLPDTYTLGEEQPSSVVWLPDGRLAVIHPGEPPNETVLVKIWQVIPTGANPVSLQKTFTIGAANLPGSLPPEVLNTPFAPDWLTALDSNTLAVAIVWPDGRAAPQLLTLDLKTGSLDRLNQAPALTQRLLWSPDGSGAILLDEQSRAFYASGDDTPLRSLHTRLGEDARRFTWMPPLPVK